MLHYQGCTLLLVATRKNALEDISAASLALHAQKFATASEKNFVPNFTNRFSGTLQKIWIWKYKGVLYAKFCRIWTESKDIGKIRIRKKLYIQIFYPLWPISLITRNWRRIIDIILEITNCKEVFSWTVAEILLSHFFISWQFLIKKRTTFKHTSLRFSINSSKYVHFWTLAIKTILILIRFLFQRYMLYAFEVWSHIWKWAPCWFSAVLKIGYFGASWPFCRLH